MKSFLMDPAMEIMVFMKANCSHVADAIVMFNDAWSAVSRVTVLKYWVKSLCLGEQHTQCLNSLIENFTAVDYIDIDRTVLGSRMSNESYNLLDHQISQSLDNALKRHEFLESELRTPLHETLEEVRGIESESQLLHILNCTAPFDAQTQKDDVSSDFLIDSYEKSRNNFARVEAVERG